MNTDARTQLYLTLVEAEISLRKAAHLYAIIIPVNRTENNNMNSQVKALRILVDTIDGMITRTAQYISTTNPATGKQS